MSYVAVLPYVYRPWRDELMSTCSLQHIWEVDNTDPESNVGVMASHNQGLAYMEARGADWLIVMSAAIRFGRYRGLDFVAHLERLDDHLVVEADGVYGWHLIAFHRRTLEAVGRWDENFTPYGYDDLDMSWRIRNAFGLSGQLWCKVPVAVGDMGMGHSVRNHGVWSDSWRLQRYYMRKWGGLTNHERYPRPFGDASHPLGYWPQAPNGGTWQ